MDIFLIQCTASCLYTAKVLASFCLSYITILLLMYLCIPSLYVCSFIILVSYVLSPFLSLSGSGLPAGGGGVMAYERAELICPPT